MLSLRSGVSVNVAEFACILPAKRVNLGRFGGVIKKGLPFRKTDNPFIFMVPGAGIEPAQPQGPRDFKSLASTNSATQAVVTKPDGL